jgi:hypothetical protein
LFKGGDLLMKKSNTVTTVETATTRKQVKILTDAIIANSFKNACDKAGVSMAGELSCFMSDYCKAAKKRKSTLVDVSTRRNRRKQVDAVVGQMERIMEAEMRYYDNFPENLRASAPFKTTYDIISVMSEVIDLLGAIYG